MAGEASAPPLSSPAGGNSGPDPPGLPPCCSPPRAGKVCAGHGTSGRRRGLSEGRRAQPAGGRRHGEAAAEGLWLARAALPAAPLQGLRKGRLRGRGRARGRRSARGTPPAGAMEEEQAAGAEPQAESAMPESAMPESFSRLWTDVMGILVSA